MDTRWKIAVFLDIYWCFDKKKKFRSEQPETSAATFCLRFQGVNSPEVDL